MGAGAGVGAGIVNVHHHFLPSIYMKAIEDRLAMGRGRRRAAEWSPAGDIERMDANAIARTIGSAPIPGVWFGDVGASRRLAREWNEYAARVTRDFPGRFGFFAAIAPPDVDGSLAEIEHAFDVLGADGIGLLSSYDRRWLGDPYFAPVMRELDRRRAVVFVHPAAVDEDAGPPGIKSHVLEGPFDTTRAIASLINNGTLAAFPDIRFIFAHGGGAIPYIGMRLALLTNGKPDFEHDRLMGLLSKLYFDTALMMNDASIAALTRFCPASQMLIGLDTPILPADRELSAWRSIAMDNALRLRIERDNAIALFQLSASGERR